MSYKAFMLETQEKTEYFEFKKIYNLPLRLPLKGEFELTYRCNNNCLHCWLKIPLSAAEEKKELSFEEIKKIADEARKMGCRSWSITGGEPMLRPDFMEIFDYLTSNSTSYSLNTNGTLITPGIARLLRRKGTKMVALYGATAAVHDHITRNPGSFEATMKGFTYLKEASAGFTVQLIPMRDNYHQFKDMLRLAQSLSKQYRIGAAWLRLSACGDAEKNREIINQRLAPECVVEVDKPDLSYEEWADKEQSYNCENSSQEDYLFASCIARRHEFYIDPYGKMSFCSFIKEPTFRYDLRNGSFKEGWEDFIPSLAKKVKANQEYRDNCGSCDLSRSCRWCPVYSYLEHRRFTARVDYLCQVAKENRKFKKNWQKNHRRYFRIAKTTIQVESDLPITDFTFHPKFRKFEVGSRGEDTVSIRHRFLFPDLESKDLGTEVYRRIPWAVYKKDGAWIYVGIEPEPVVTNYRQIVIFNKDYTSTNVYHKNEERFLKGDNHSLSLTTTDQLFLVPLLADRNGCILHSCGVGMDGKGLLFAGNSGAGKSTIARLLKGKAEILCDDRIIVKKETRGFNIYGTWSHGEVEDISNSSFPLKGIFFLEKSEKNYLLPLKDKKEVMVRLLARLVKSFVTAQWWAKTIPIIIKISDEVPCYSLCFDKSGQVAGLLEEFCLGQKK